MATQTLATADAILKDLYRGPIIEQLNYKTYMLDRIQRDSESVDMYGRRAIFPVHSAPNFSPTSITDGGTLPTPGFQGVQDAIVAIRYHAASFEISDAAAKQANGNDGAFVNLLQFESEKIAKDLKKQINRQVMGDGTGLLATLTSSPAAANNFTVDSTQYLKVGQPVDILTKSTGAGSAVSLTITAINRTTKTVTVSANVTQTTTTDGLYAPGARNNELDGGLRAVTGTSRTLHSINSATAGNEFWNGARRAASGATAGEGLFEQLADDIGASGDGEVEVFITSRGIKRRLADTYQSTKRFTNADAVTIHGGYSAIFVNEIPVIADDDVPKGWVFALREDAFKWVQVGDPDWLASPKDGTVFQQSPGSTIGQLKAAWRASFVWYASLASVAPNRTGAIPDAADDAS
jgi:hypothetical protein